MKYTQILKISLIIFMILSTSFIECVEISRQHAKHVSKKHKLVRKQKLSKAEQQMQLLIKLGEKVLNQRYSQVNDQIHNEIKNLFDLYNAKEIQLQFTEEQIKDMKDENKADGPFSARYENLKDKIKQKFDDIQKLYAAEQNKLQAQAQANQAKIQQIAKESQLISEIESCKQEVFNVNKKIQESNTAVKEADSEADKEAISFEIDGLVKALGVSVTGCTLKTQEFINTVNPEIAAQQKQKQLSELQDEAKKLITKSFERNLPPKFCWKIVTPNKSCQDQSFELKFFKCRKKCVDGQSRFGVWCLEDCTRAEQTAKTCEIRTIGLRIAKKDSRGEWDSHFRDWTRSESNENYLETCPAPYKKQEIEATFFKSKRTICVSDPEVQCHNIGMQNCGSKRACSTTTTDCVLTIASIAADITIGILKFASLFVAPGVVNALEWAVKAVEWAESLKNVIDKIAKSLEFFKDIHENKVQRQILIQKVFNEVKDNEIFQKLDTAANARFNKKKSNKKTSLTDLQKKILMYIQYHEAHQYLEIEKDIDFEKPQSKINEKVFEQIEAYKTAADQVLKNSINNWIGRSEKKKFFLFQKETYVGIYEALTMKNDSNAIRLKTTLGYATSFDPSGITNILKAFIYDQCPSNGYFTDAQIADIKLDKKWTD